MTKYLVKTPTTEKVFDDRFKALAFFRSERSKTGGPVTLHPFDPNDEDALAKAKTAAAGANAQAERIKNY